MKKVSYQLLALLVTVLFYACEETIVDKQNSKTAKSNVAFSVSPVTPSNGRASETIIKELYPSSVIISVKDASGNYVLNTEKLDLIRVGNGFITKNIAFSEGTYTVEDFMVLNSEETAILLTPKEDSKLANLVDNPLPVAFTVSAKKENDVVLEVVPVDLGDPAHYGYATFSFDVVNTLEKGLIGYYQFDGNVEDSSQYANHAINFTDGIYREGIHGRALYFDGINDYLTLENSLSLVKEFSFSFWVNSEGAPNSFERNGAIISKYRFHQKSFYITTYGYADNHVNRMHASFFGGNSNRQRDWVTSYMDNDYLRENQYDPSLWNIVDSDTLTTRKWTHVVVNMDSSTLSMYIDGELKVSKQREYDVYNDSSEKTHIGNIFNGGEGNNNHFHGYLDELRIYDRSLYAQEIEALYHH